MPPPRPPRAWLPILLLIGLADGIAHAERLPISRYTITEGLPHDRVYCLTRDSRGFLWFCTAEGLSRFDGHEFKTYDRTAGLPHALINDLLETRAGAYWVATNGGGIAYLEADRSHRSRGRFTPMSVGHTPGSQRVNALFEDGLGQIWAATDDGVFVSRGDPRQATLERVELGLVPRGDTVHVWDVVEDKAGTIWIATSVGLSRRLRDGRLMNYQPHPTRVEAAVWALTVDDRGRVWAGLDDGVVVLDPASLPDTEGPHPWTTLLRETIPAWAVAHPARKHVQRTTHGVSEVPGAARRYTFPGLGDRNWIRALHCASDGRVWVGTSSGSVYSFDGEGFRPYTTNHRLTTDKVLALGEDIDGNVWVGTYASGAMKLAREGFVAYGRSDGLSGGVVRSILEDVDGLVHVVTDDLRVHRFEGAAFTAVRPNVPRPVDAARLWHTALQDRQGEWWITTGEGLFRFPRVSRLEGLGSTRPVARYTVVNGLPIRDVRRAFEDSRGDLWLRTRAAITLIRWNHLTGTFHGFSESDGLRPSLVVNAVAEDRSGQIWIGFRESGVARLRNGRFEHVTARDGVPDGDVQTLYADTAGRLWIGTIGGGVGRIDDPTATSIAAQKYTTSEGLSSNTVRGFTEDRWGRIYLGTAKGVNRLNPDTGHIRVYTTAEGLPGNEVHAAYRDRGGRLWFGMSNGVATLLPEPDQPHRALSVSIGGVQIAGRPRSVSDFGEAEVSRIKLGAKENQLRIAFFAPAFGPAGAVRYQYRLEGADRDWNPPTDQRTVNYERLAPGHYRFIVGVLADGAMSERTASLAFQILPPWWQRWWCISIAMMLMGMASAAFHRARLKRVLDMQRVHGRIATDLHDDIGSGLSQIAILSEVAIKAMGSSGRAREPLARIAATSRELVDTMSDIVWAISPRSEQLGDLTQRMRRFASDMLGSRDIAFRLSVPTAAEHAKIGPHIRREVYLVFKESVTNVVRHSGCSEAEIELRLDRQQLILQIRDNGRGVPSTHLGNGLASMRARAARLGGSLAVSSQVGQGTTLAMRLPLGSHGR